MSFMHRQSLSLRRLDEVNEREYQIWCSSFLIIVAAAAVHIHVERRIGDVLIMEGKKSENFNLLKFIFCCPASETFLHNAAHSFHWTRGTKKNCYHDRLKIALYIFQNFSCKTQQSQQQQLKLHLGSSRDFKQRRRERKNITEMSLNKLIIWSWVDRRDQPRLLFVGLQKEK